MKPLIQKSTIAFMLIWIFTGNEFAFTADSDSLISSKTNEIKVNADTSSMMSVATTKKPRTKYNAFKQWYNSSYADEFQPASNEKSVSEKKWYESFAIRGYAQFRYNAILDKDSKLKCEQCDKNWSETGGFSIRRMRIILYGHIGKRVYFYIQPDFASSSSSTALHFAQLRDAYVDVSVDKNNEFRFRVGQSKVPFGFENMQSSQNRLPFDRNDALNSAVSNERDLGVFFYWAPKAKRELFSILVKEGFKGSGDYGIVGFGIYNGQTANKPELNKAPHVVARVTYPFKAKKQILEMAFQGYSGKYIISKELISSGAKSVEDRSYHDQRIAGSFILYPKPFGIQAEYNFGRGPEYNKATDSIEVKKLHGGYITLSYIQHIKKQILIPYFRAQYYDGGKKHELDARSYTVQEYEVGFEWQPVKQFELVAAYSYANRRFEDHVLQNNIAKGNSIRIQAQVNF